MKTLITFATLLVLTNMGHGQFWKPKPKATPVPVVKAEAVQSPTNNLQEARKIIRELNLELESAKTENTKLKINLENATKSLDAAQKSTITVQRNADILRDWGIAKQNESFEWMAKHQKTLAKYHRLKYVASIVGGIFGLIFGIWLMRFVPPIYATYAFALPIITTLISSGWVWLFF
jgi:hypothetical protein